MSGRRQLNGNFRFHRTAAENSYPGKQDTGRLKLVPDEPKRPDLKLWIGVTQEIPQMRTGSASPRIIAPKIIQRIEPRCVPAILPRQPQIGLPQPAVVREFAGDVLRGQRA